eukprot:CAMPEP_0177247392 /NCGR_PEP_ID=MMETSP0367-20130122/51555_1 /TAXON_ID=447022 ORGANISM="Scrippsiella hangoei-like, Strain SHHI-4" /NCGR_SAMPLE_ID=MMETSP0367 /ASSEMBLY_ACC=CAM_ASM_000362 /LENGTH=141 /DNA_ID=CAMNT_0018699549 /DNA_START=144 /DNA_END=566 /DNA_ORIENTATION=-
MELCGGTWKTKEAAEASNPKRSAQSRSWLSPTARMCSRSFKCLSSGRRSFKLRTCSRGTTNRCTAAEGSRGTKQVARSSSCQPVRPRAPSPALSRAEGVQALADVVVDAAHDLAVCVHADALGVASVALPLARAAARSLAH